MPQCMIKIWGDRSCHTPSPTNNFSFYLPPYFKMFLERFLNDLPLPPPHFKYFSLLPPPLSPPLLPNKTFDHAPSVFRINEILITWKQYFEGLRAIVDETNNNYQEFNHLQYGGGGEGEGHYGPPVGFSYTASKRLAVERWNFRTFSIYVLGIWKCTFDSPETQLAAMATLLLRGFCGSFKENYKQIANFNMISPSDP